MSLTLQTKMPLSHEKTTIINQRVRLAMGILMEVMKFRRVAGPHAECAKSPCQACLAPHLSKVVSAIEQGKPIVFVLPAFPGKSPNHAKVLGPLPDMAERCALEFLNQLCDRLRIFHPPGAQIILCSDGRAFSDTVGMKDEDVTSYRHELSRMIESMSLTHISMFDLDDVYKGLDFDEMRAKLMAHHGKPLDLLKAKVRDGGKSGNPQNEEAHRMYCGITRFLVEDSMHPGQTKSRTAIQKECRVRAYEVIQRSNAWTELIEGYFPSAIRLSIHPQTCGSVKLGIRLMEAESWMTPWHGVAVHTEGRFVLLKRAQAEALGADLVTRFGRPSHFVLTAKENLSTLLEDKNET